MWVFLLIHDGKAWEFPPFQHPLVNSTSLRPRPFQGTGRVASGGALASEVLRATGVRPESLKISNPLFPSVFLILFESGRLPRVFFAQSEIGHSLHLLTD